METIERPKLRMIKGTSLAYILTPVGVKGKNGFDKYIDYLSSKTDAVVSEEPMRGQRVLREYCYKIYKLNGMSLEELDKAVKNNTAQLVGDMMFAVTNQNLELDENGNLLLKSYASDLENIKIEGGDVLLSADGEVLRKTNGQMFIREADACGNYLCDVFVAQSKPMSDVVNIERIDFNFLDSNGKKVSRQNFERKDEPVLYTIDRTYSDPEKMFLDKTILPTAYVYMPDKSSGETPQFFPSATMLLVENRARLMENPNATPIVADEREYLEAHYQRLLEIPRIEEKLTQKNASGSMNFDVYRRSMATLEREKQMTNLFLEFETDRDREIAYAIETGDFSALEELEK